MASIADMLDIRRQKAWDDYHAEMFAENTYTQQARQAADALRLAQIKKDQADERMLRAIGSTLKQIKAVLAHGKLLDLTAHPICVIVMTRGKQNDNTFKC